MEYQGPYFWAASESSSMETCSAMAWSRTVSSIFSRSPNETGAVA
jgi:hypothetical protein